METRPERAPYENGQYRSAAGSGCDEGAIRPKNRANCVFAKASTRCRPVEPAATIARQDRTRAQPHGRRASTRGSVRVPALHRRRTFFQDLRLPPAYSAVQNGRLSFPSRQQLFVTGICAGPGVAFAVSVVLGVARYRIKKGLAEQHYSGPG